MSESVVNDIIKWLETQLQRNEGSRLILLLRIRVVIQNGISSVFSKISRDAH